MLRWQRRTEATKIRPQRKQNTTEESALCSKACHSLVLFPRAFSFWRLPFCPSRQHSPNNRNRNNPTPGVFSKALAKENSSRCPRSNAGLKVDGTSCLTVRLLESGAGTLTTELLGLHLAVVGNEECAVVGNESLLELVLAVLIDVLLVVGDLYECGVSDLIPNRIADLRSWQANS